MTTKHHAEHHAKHEHAHLSHDEPETVTKPDGKPLPECASCGTKGKVNERNLCAECMKGR